MVQQVSASCHRVSHENIKHYVRTEDITRLALDSKYTMLYNVHNSTTNSTIHVYSTRLQYIYYYRVQIRTNSTTHGRVLD